MALILAISFYTFSQIAYLVNIYKDRDGVSTNILDYLFYILYFPKIISGPIVEPAELIEQIHDMARKKIDWINVAGGSRIFCYGLFKKMLLADTFASYSIVNESDITVKSEIVSTSSSGDFVDSIYVSNVRPGKYYINFYDF